MIRSHSSWFGAVWRYRVERSNSDRLNGEAKNNSLLVFFSNSRYLMGRLILSARERSQVLPDITDTYASSFYRVEHALCVHLTRSCGEIRGCSRERGVTTINSSMLLCCLACTTWPKRRGEKASTLQVCVSPLSFTARPILGFAPR